MDLSQAKKNESVRNDVIEYLGARPMVAQSAETIRRKLSKENPEYTLIDVLQALDFLVGLELVKKAPDELGSTNYYEITTKGTLYIERKFGL